MPKVLSSFARAAIVSLVPLALACSPSKSGDRDESSIAALGAAQTIRFGVAPQWYQQYNPPAQGPANVDAVAVGDWLIENGFTDAHAAKVNAIIAKNKVPYFFGYILTALTKKGLGESSDCDGDPNRKLCKQGADWVRAHIDDAVVPVYREAGRRIGNAVGGKEALIHMEPDFFQFSEKAQTNALTRGESNATMNKILGAIREGCASCKVVIDFSPWFSPDKTAWATSAADFYSGWDRSVVKYVGLTGKPFPFTEGKIDNFTYKEISTALNLPLVVIDAYTYGGGPIDIDRSWLDTNNLVKAADMGVSYVFLAEQGDIAGYDAFIAALRAPGSPPPGSGPGTPPAPPPPPSPPTSSDAGTSGPGAAPTFRTEGGNIDVWLEPMPGATGHPCWRGHVTSKDGGTIEWRVRITRTGAVDYVFNATLHTEDREWVFGGAEFNRLLDPGKSTEFGYCYGM